MPIKVILFDFMGTCLDWHSTITSVLPPDLTADQRSTFALEWRQAYFDYNASRLAAGQPVEDFDETQRRVLDLYLSGQPESIAQHFSQQGLKQDLTESWHRQRAWPDVAPALGQLRRIDRRWELFVHANGSTRLQLDLTRFAGLQFDMLFSSELLGCYKPGIESYRKVMEILKVRPEECVLVAAHAYDTRGAKQAGMKTVYVYRWTDDIREDQNVVRNENDAYLEDMSALAETIKRL